jgi:hypothetical protein
VRGVGSRIVVNTRVKSCLTFMPKVFQEFPCKGRSHEGDPAKESKNLPAKLGEL